MRKTHIEANIPTVTESADFGFIPLFWLPQGLQRCLEKQNHPLNSNLVVWCAKIGPKTQKLQKTVEKPSFFVVFLVISEVFQTFKLLGPILAHQTTKFELSGWFCFSRHPWGPWGCQNSGMKPKSADSVTVVLWLLIQHEYLCNNAECNQHDHVCLSLFFCYQASLLIHTM